MNAVKVLRAAEAAGVRIQRAGGALELAAACAPPAALIDAVRGCKSELLTLLEESCAASTSHVPLNVPAETRGGEPAELDLYHGLSEDELKAIAGDDWDLVDDDPALLAAFSGAVADRRQRERGQRPPGWTHRVTCAGCGPVHLWSGSPLAVLACPWCFNRLEGRPIPRPTAVTCAHCVHFERIKHPHLGHCAGGEPEPPAGLWDTDQRACNRWQPHCITSGISTRG